MRKQARSNRAKVRPTPAVQNTICVITRRLIAMMIADFNSLSALVCSTERARRRPRSSGIASRNKHVAVQKFFYIQFWLFRSN